MRVSVVIPTYKRPSLLRKCLHALYNQVFNKFDYEIIVVSDGPDLSTLYALRNFLVLAFPKFEYVQLPEKKGPAAARNAGWKKASGDLIAFTDDDCIPDPYWLKNLYEAFANSNNPSAAFTGRTVVPIPIIPTDYELNISHLSRAEFITANCACSQKALMRAGGFDETFTMAWREDSDLQFKFINQGIPIRPVETAVVVHPVRKKTWGACLKDEKKNMFDALLYKKFPELYERKIQVSRPWLYYAIIAFFMLFIFGAILNSLPPLIAGLSGWLILTLWFAFKRLRSTSRNVSHVVEMMVTSFAIPFLSLYWRWYGAFKYKAGLI
jgi:glycosyltransferase involved in cell wall biosynthesis